MFYVQSIVIIVTRIVYGHYLLVSFTKNVITECLGHLAWPILWPVQRVVKEAVQVRRYHRGNKWSDCPWALKQSDTTCQKAASGQDVSKT